MDRLATGRFVFGGTVMALLTFGCSGSDGRAGSDGAIGAAGAMGTNGDAGAAGDMGAKGVAGPNGLTRTTAEPVGPHCASGGSAIAYGLDANANGVLDDEEIAGTAYVCDGSPGGAQLSDVPVGDLRCPHGGISVLLDGKLEGVACNGAPGATGAAGDKGDVGDVGDTGASGVTGDTGANGATGAQGDKGDAGDLGDPGAKGPTGDPGAAGAKGDRGDTGDAGAKGPDGHVGDPGGRGPHGDEGDAGAKGPTGDAGPIGAPMPDDRLGQFVATQIVKGAVLTCVTTSVSATAATCTGLRVDGLAIALDPAASIAICGVITGKTYRTGGGSGSIGPPYLRWSNGWTLGTAANVAPMDTLTCVR